MKLSTRLPRARFTAYDLITAALLFLFGLAAVLLSGCAQVSYSVTKPDGTHVTAGAYSLFSNQAVRGFNADSSTEKTRTGLKFTNTETSPELEALGALIGAAVKNAK